MSDLLIGQNGGAEAVATPGQENVVPFTLTYDGPLRSSHSKAAQKHAIRRILHPQLKALWDLPPFADKRKAIDPGATDGDAGTLLKTVGPYTFATLVSDYYKLRTKLHILILKREPAGGLVTHAGDIDNRLKTLLDAMQCPQHPQEIPAGWTPGPDEIPLHCLLADDRLVTRIDVDTERWLAPGNVDDVRVIVKIELWAPSPTWWSIGVLG